MQADIRIDISRAKSAAVGKEHGITPAEFQAIEPRVLDIHKILQQERKDKAYGFYDLHKDEATIKAVKESAKKYAEFGYENLVVLGIGGSALGITALNTALNPTYYNLLTKRGRKGFPRLFVMDNIDPVTFRAMLRLCPPQKTLYNVISKSGGTAETMSQLMIVLEILEAKLGKDKVKDHLVVTTSPQGPNAPKSLLHPVAKAYGLDSFDIPLNVGGRFSVFTPVGLFPAALLGLDIDGLMEGCAAMDKRCSVGSLMDNPAYLRAAVHYMMDKEKGKVMSVMMPYVDGLRDVADWYRQLWAESLGKKFSLDGEEVYAGQTPIKALGATDQHSQVQLFREGPNDKIFSTLEAGRFDKTLKIPANLTEIADLDYLRGASMNKLMTAELVGTLDALKASLRPAIRVILPKVNAHTVGQLLYMLEVETAMAGRLYNVNTFDQPGVEEGKIIARRLMGGQGVSDEARGERQDANNRHLLPYGVGGDYVGARRTRRAFRLLVFACIGFTFSLYFVEKYMRYERTEVHYRMSLTLEDDSQRAILRHVVRSDAEKREVPTAKYVEALAYIEEDDLVLERFAEAVKLAPDKGSLWLVYGCKLFQQRHYTEARQILREATLKSSRNALPKYLQAAAIAASSETEDDFRTAMALVSRANDSGEAVLFPQPLWHETLPKRGNWYEMLERRLADECCAPLYHLRNAVIKRARAALDEGDFQTYDGWLLQLQRMGERLVGEPSIDGASPGTSPAICGLQIQKDALAMRIALRDRRGGGGVPREELAARATVVDAAIARVLEFEAERETQVAEAEGHVARPLWLAGNGLLLLGLAVCIGWIFSKAFRTDKNARTLRQSRSGIYVLFGWIALMAILLLLSGLLKMSGLQTAIAAGWYLLMGGITLFALVAPLSALPAVEQLCQPFVAEPDYTERLREARRRRRKAYWSLSSRYLNIVLGSYVILLSVYFIGFRVFTGLYPTDIKLLTTGMELREIVLFNDLYQML